MIERLSDFHCTDVSPFSGHLDDFTSYPERAGVAGSLPFRSLEDLDDVRYPVLRCLDPAWLTEAVRQRDDAGAAGWVSLFSIFGPSSSYSDHLSPILPGDDWVRRVREDRVPAGNGSYGGLPPVATVGFLDEAHRTIRSWAEAWESFAVGRMPSGVNGLPVVPDKNPACGWTTIGAISITWNTDKAEYPWIVPPNAADYEFAKAGESFSVAASCRKKLAELALRDFLTVQVFDNEVPDDDPSELSFSWTSIGDDGDDSDPRSDRDSRFKMLARKILAVHSDCELASTWFITGFVPENIAEQFTFYGDVSEETTYSPRHTTSGDGDKCWKVERRDVSPSSRNYRVEYSHATHNYYIFGMPFNDSERIPVERDFMEKVRRNEGIIRTDGYPLRYSRAIDTDQVYHPPLSCSKGGETIYAVQGFWDSRSHNHEEYRLKEPLRRIVSYLPGGPPSFVEVESVWAVVVAWAQELDAERVEERTLLSDGSTKTVYHNTGSLRAGCFMAVLDATRDSNGRITVPSIPSVPSPSGGVKVTVPGLDQGEADPPASGGAGALGTTDEIRVRETEDLAVLDNVVGFIVKFKFGASVKRGG